MFRNHVTIDCDGFAEQICLVFKYLIVCIPIYGNVVVAFVGFRYEHVHEHVLLKEIKAAHAITMKN